MKDFPCQKCGTMIKPPEILPPKVLGAGIGTFKIEIKYECPKCRKVQRSEINGKIEMEIIIKEKQKH